MDLGDYDKIDIPNSKINTVDPPKTELKRKYRKNRDSLDKLNEELKRSI